MSLPAVKANAPPSASQQMHARARNLGKTQKAAIILASLTPELATQIVAEISDEQLRRFATAFAELDAVPTEELNAVLLEFIVEVRQSSSQLVGGGEEAHRVLSLMTDTERTDRVFKSFAKETPKSAWEAIGAIEPKLLSDYLGDKKASVAAAVFSRLDYETTAAVLEHCDEAFTQRVLLTLSKSGPPSDRVVEEIAAAIETELLAPLAAKSDISGAARFVGEIINYLSGARRDGFLDFLTSTDAELATIVRRSLLIFEELHQRLPQSAVTAITKDLDRNVFLSALKFGDQNAKATVDFIFANMSKRMAEQLREELSELKEVCPAEGEAAQRRMVALIKQMVADGAIVLQQIANDDDA